MDMGGTINNSLETSTKNLTADSTACQIYKYKAGRGFLILFSAFTVITQLASSIDIPANPAARHIDRRTPVNKPVAYFSQRTTIYGAVYGSVGHMYSRPPMGQPRFSAAIDVSFDGSSADDYIC